MKWKVENGQMGDGVVTKEGEAFGQRGQKLKRNRVGGVKMKGKKKKGKKNPPAPGRAG